MCVRCLIVVCAFCGSPCLFLFLFRLTQDRRTNLPSDLSLLFCDFDTRAAAMMQDILLPGCPGSFQSAALVPGRIMSANGCNHAHREIWSDVSTRERSGRGSSRKIQKCGGGSIRNVHPNVGKNTIELSLTSFLTTVARVDCLHRRVKNGKVRVILFSFLLESAYPKRTPTHHGTSAFSYLEIVESSILLVVHETLVGFDPCRYRLQHGNGLLGAHDG